MAKRGMITTSSIAYRVSMSGIKSGGIGNIELRVGTRLMKSNAKTKFMTRPII